MGDIGSRPPQRTGTICHGMGLCEAECDEARRSDKLNRGVRDYRVIPLDRPSTTAEWHHFGTSLSDTSSGAAKEQSRAPRPLLRRGAAYSHPRASVHSSYPWTGLRPSPIIVSAAMTFSSVSVIANALRLRRIQL
jgi:hypothetical protein